MTARATLDGYLERGVITPKEHEVMLLREAGLSFRQIADALGISRRSVRDRVANARLKCAYDGEPLRRAA